jgi:cell division septal protein FtsQ
MGRGEPELHYLRRQGNLRVRKARWMKNLLRPWKVVVGNGVAAALLLLGGIRAVTQILSSDAFALNRIEVEGTRRTTADRVEAQLHGFVGQSVWRIDLDDVAARATEDAWVQSASVKRILPKALRVQVVERTPTALALLDGSVQVVDATGTSIGAVGPGLEEDLPVLTGLGELRGEARRGRLEQGVAAVQTLSAAVPDWIDQISELDVSAEDAFVVTTRKPGPRIVLEPQAADRNVATYLARRRDIETRVGSAASVDLRWRGRITVLPTPDKKDKESR